jgi:polar amino acid transport system substrate-binding protein
MQKALDELREDGTLKEISEKWLGDDYTSNIDLELY